MPSPRRLRPALLLGALLALAAPAGARAGYFPGDAIDGPSPEIVSAGDLDVARDGTGAVAYVKRDGGVDHIFVSRLLDGAFTAPERIDAALPTPSSQPVVGASEGGRVAVAFVSGGTLHTTLHVAGNGTFSPPQAIATDASDPSIDMSINGVAYVSFTTAGGGGADVRVARLARNTSQFELLGAAVDIDPALPAGAGAGRSHVAISADGTAVVTWGEAGHAWARRVFGTRLSTAPQDLNVTDVQGLTGGGVADAVTVDIEDDSSYAWALFRQTFADGRQHVVARRLVGSAFEAPVLVDGLGVPAGADATEFAVELNGRGEGLAATGAGGAGVFGAVLHEDKFFPGTLLGAGTAASHPAVGIASNNNAFAAWLPGDGSVHIRPYDIDPTKRTPPPPGPDAVLSRAAFGPVVAEAGMDMAVNRAGDAAAVFVQEGADGRRLVSAVYDRPPGSFTTNTTTKYRSSVRPALRWQPAFDIWGPLTYRVEVDGTPIGQTTDTTLTPLAPVAEGEHKWRVVATDRRGQSSTARSRPLRVDSLPPEVALSVTGVKKRGRVVKVTVRAADGSLDAPAGSGVAVVRIDFGDGTRLAARTATHRYARGGRVTIRVSATDKVGNAIAITKRITIAKK